ncbi:hypothetical protein [Tsukamurella sp. NPDC003166]|uniref:hypothetical protein n=1 Tax=Tsukamurella sp. NPDC003166 TaxID=3154444 RepID=UPI0033BCC6FA
MKHEVAIAYTVALAVMLFLLNTAYLGLQGAGTAWFVLAVLATLVVAAVTLRQWLRPSARRVVSAGTGDRVNFVWIVVFEAAAMGAGNSYVLRHQLDTGWMVVWSAAVVAVHFVVMAWSKRNPVYAVIAVVLGLGVVGGVLAGSGPALSAVPITVLFLTLAVSIVVSDVRGRRASPAPVTGAN